MSLITLITL